MPRINSHVTMKKQWDEHSVTAHRSHMHKMHQIFQSIGRPVVTHAKNAQSIDLPYNVDIKGTHMPRMYSHIILLTKFNNEEEIICQKCTVNDLSDET